LQSSVSTSKRPCSHTRTCRCDPPTRWTETQLAADEARCAKDCSRAGQPCGCRSSNRSAG
jgi:hypothetical protein